MAKIVFLQQLPEEWLGVMYLSSMLKSHGHQCDIYVERLERNDFIQKALSEAPDLVAFSCLTCDYPWALKKAEAIKKESTSLVIMGGTHITLNPDEVISSPDVDIICLGEGEHPMAELADAVEAREDYSHIKNLWMNKDGRVVRNEIRNLTEELDALPHPDRGLYAKYPFFGTGGSPLFNSAADVLFAVGIAIMQASRTFITVKEGSCVGEAWKAFLLKSMRSRRKGESKFFILLTTVSASMENGSFDF